MTKKQNRKYVEISVPFTVTVPTNAWKDRITWMPNGVYITYDLSNIYLNYAGTRAADSEGPFRLPTAPKFLRELAVFFK
jgi:hypothetical protein